MILKEIFPDKRYMIPLALKYIKLYKNGKLTESQEYDWGHIYEKIIFTYDNNQVQEKVYNQ